MKSSADTIAVAAAQYPLDAPATFARWQEKVAQWVSEGAAGGAGLLVFPEYGGLEVAAIHGPDVTADLAATLDAVAASHGDTGRVWQRLAREHGVHILAPSGPERRNGGFVNAARLYAPGGGVGVQDKLIMTPFEHGWGIQAGRGQRVFETALGRIGIAICYDSEFPLLVRALTEAGAEIVLVPSCTEHASGYNRVRTAAMARALESQIATVMSPTIGDAPWSVAIDRNHGAAGVFVPADVGLSMTGVLAAGAPDRPGWIAATIDLLALRRLRASGETRNDRDWPLQDGAAALAGGIEVVRLE